MLTAFAVLISFTAVLAYLNERFIRLPTTVGVTLAGAVASFLMVLLDGTGLAPGVHLWAASVLKTLNFTDFVLNGVLSLLLFAGALSLDVGQMLKQRNSILILAIFSTILSTFIIGYGAYIIWGIIGLGVPLIWAMLFGSLISPTDPVAVLDLLKRAKVPKKIETLIAGESLFNDGVGVVIYLVVIGIAGIGTHNSEPSIFNSLILFVKEAIGGSLFGALIGYIGFLAISSIKEHSVEVLISLAMVIGGYVLAASIGVSGPLAMVVAGLIMSAKKEEAFTHETREHVESFWETTDQVFNILLFSFIGLDVLLTRPNTQQIIAAVLLAALALIARWISVVVPMLFLRASEGYAEYTVRLLTWGGLRGGIAISLGLGLPESEYRGTLLTATYFIVLFTIVVQGLSIMPLVHKAVAADKKLEGYD